MDRNMEHDMNENTQIGGTHYQHQSFQHWDFATEVVKSNDYLKGCASKYLVRWRDKNGLEDLRKALSYINKLINMEHIADSTIDRSVLATFCDQLDIHEAHIIYCIYTNNYIKARNYLIKLIEENQNGIR